ncbi:Acyl-coenzyme A thioesterase 9, mitochondrial [Orbilia oligospora]|uniref:Acyl-coenzyme A thioesterase 9, mitochondrial n=1 Tax=Orbilia oligospora TaxID=2813651 RepID=A0A7C8J414_ORBOL|nr:Acyl-coenzyme A thioesterase 9, mitochondrial [Orbilia oligospora]
MQRITAHTALRNVAAMRQLNCRVLPRITSPRGHSHLDGLRMVAARRYISAPAQPTLLSPKFTVPWLKALAMRDHPTEPSPVAQETKGGLSPLTPKRMTDSYSSYTLEFGKDEWLVDAYVNSTGQLRLGTIFMDLDALAGQFSPFPVITETSEPSNAPRMKTGVVAYKHAGEGQTIVTAAVDRISLLYHPTSFCDMELRGMVTWTSGRSSMEISLEVVALEENKTILTCQFTMVALDPVTKKSVLVKTGSRLPSSPKYYFYRSSPNDFACRATAVNPLIVETAEENRIFARGEGNFHHFWITDHEASGMSIERNRFKRALASTSLEKQAPNEEESNLIHTMWRESQRYKGKNHACTLPLAYIFRLTFSLQADPGSGVEMPENIVYVADTQIQTTQVMQPQYRNRHIFGGLLLRNSFELAFCCAAAASHSRPRFLSMSPSVFRESVPVGGILYLTATVVYTEPAPAGGSRVQIRVDSKVRDVHHSSLRNTGTFTYTFDTEEEFKVLPKTYGEFVSYIDARRKAEAERSWADTSDDVPDTLEASVVE